jgi:hypothetical protein
MTSFLASLRVQGRAFGVSMLADLGDGTVQLEQTTWLTDRKGPPEWPSSSLDPEASAGRTDSLGAGFGCAASLPA